MQFYLHLILNHAASFILPPNIQFSIIIAFIYITSIPIGTTMWQK